MTIPLTGAGSLFVRGGHLFGRMIDANALRGGPVTARVLTLAPVPTSVVNIIRPDYANGTAIPQVISGMDALVGGLQNGISSWITGLSTTLQNTLLAMWSIDTQAVSSKAPVAQLTPASQLTQSLKDLIAQMVTAGASVQGATVSAGAQTAVGTPTGNPIVVTSLKNGQGIGLQLPFAETITFTCTGDSQGTATLGNEPFSAVGQPAVDPLTWLYPTGSGASKALSAIDGSKNNSAGNSLYNSDWTTFTTTNYPDNWVIAVGAVTTNVLNGTSSNAYTSGGGSLQFLGDGGGTLTAVVQPFNKTATTSVGAGGTPATLLPDTVYHVNGWLKCSATPGAGIVTFALVDRSSTAGTIVNDDAGTANSFTKSLTAVSTAYVNVSGSFRTPAVLPATGLGFRIQLSTAIDSGKSVYFGRFSFAPGSQLYAGGPFSTIHSGSTAVIAGLIPDHWTVAISNNYATTGSGLMQLLWDQVFLMRSKGLQLPFDPSPTIADSLIV